MKRILIFSLAYYPHVGGAEIAIKEITGRIPDIEFEMITLRFGSEQREERVGTVLVHRVGLGSAYISKIVFVPLAALAARRLHKQKKFDGAWAMMSYMGLLVALLRLMGLRLPYVLTLQEGDTFEHMFKRFFIRPLTPFLRYAFRHASVIQTISTFLAKWPARMGYYGHIEVIPNGVDIKIFTGVSIPHEDRVLITTSRLVHKNAIDDVIRALPLLPNIRFQILGTGPDEAMLKQLAKTEGVLNRVEFVGHVNHADMPKYLNAADIFIRPSRSEGMGNSFIEAMATGLPVIATQEGGIADFLFDAKRNPDKPTTGWAVDKDSSEQIVEAVNDILDNPEKSKKVIETARNLVLTKYNWDTIAKTMQNKVFLRLFTKNY